MPHADYAARWGPFAGLAAAVVPAAVIVHLVAEGLSLGPGGLTLDFVLRHVYLAALFAASLVAFARTVGLGAGRTEIRRRTALLRSALAGVRRPAALLVLIAAYLTFFGLTQADEGFPVLSGSLWLGLGAGIAGSILSAMLVYAFGRSVIAAAAAALDWLPRRARDLRAIVLPRTMPLPRAAASTFTLFIPNRPPPLHPFTFCITHFEGIHLCSAWFARRVGRQRSFFPPLIF